MDAGGADGGNYKGVMLCNRPTEPSARGPGAASFNPQVDAPSFRPVGLPMEPLGLNPAKENLVTNVLSVRDEADRRRAEQPRSAAPNVLNKHRSWLHEMAKKKATLNSELQASAQAAEAKRKKFTAYTKSLRAALRKRQAELGLVPDDDAPAAEPPRAPAPEAAPAPAQRGRAETGKPAWALTETQADAVEDEEADALVDFANNLDYESYIDDLEVRQALSVIKERIDTEKAMTAAAEAAEAAEAAVAEAGGDWRSTFLSEWNGEGSQAGGEDDRASVRSSRRGGAAAEGMGETGQPAWDASTVAGDEKRSVASDSARLVADELLKSNPSLAAKHSVKSLASVVESTRKGEADEGGWTEQNLPPLKIVTIHENPRVRKDAVDASNLPYLHRNPAI